MSSSPIPDLEEDEVTILDPPGQTPHNHVSQHHPRPGQWPGQHHTLPPHENPAMDPCAGQMFYTPATSGPPASVWSPVPAPVLDSCQGYGQCPSLPLHPMQLPPYPVGQDLTGHHQLPEHTQALTPATAKASRKTKRNKPSPTASKKRRLDAAPGSFSSGFRHDQTQALLPAESSSSAATTSAEDTLGPRDMNKPVYVSPSAALLRAKQAGAGFQEHIKSRSLSPEPLPPPSSTENEFGSRDTKETRFPQTSSPPRVPTQGEIRGPSATQSPAKEPPPPSPVATEPVLCPEQAALVDLICSGRNVFYTGSAGCGKSTVLRAFTKRLKEMGKRVHILAPTGRAALQVNGATTWTYAGWTPDSHKRPLEELQERAHGKLVWKRFDETDVIVIDEISMVENLHFERLNRIMQHALFDPSLDVQKAFGGVQVVVTGDFCQLPPVRPFQHCMECGKELVEGYYRGEPSYSCPNPRHPVWRDEDKWAFASNAWDQCNFVHVNLKTIHRQNDLKFIRILNKCRIGEALTESDKQILMNHPSNVHHATKLFATREEVARVNQQHFEKLKSPKHTYWARDTFRWQQKRHPNLSWKARRKAVGPKGQEPLQALDDHRFDQYVELKKGMLVVLLTNLSLHQGLCNGSQGIVCGFKPYEEGLLPDFHGDYAGIKQHEVKSYIEGPGAEQRVWPVVKFHNGITRVIHADCSINELGDGEPYSLLSRTQIPLAPAWAMTIHKSQSLTLERVIVDLSKTFEVGQVYVALSRATGLEGLKVEGDVAGLETGLGGNKRVQGFLRHHFGDLNE